MFGNGCELAPDVGREDQGSIVPLRVKTERESPKRALACHEVTQYLSQDHDLIDGDVGKWVRAGTGCGL